MSLGYICPGHRTMFRSANFPYDYRYRTLGDLGLRRMCLQFIRASYDFLPWLLSTFLTGGVIPSRFWQTMATRIWNFQFRAIFVTNLVKSQLLSRRIHEAYRCSHDGHTMDTQIAHDDTRSTREGIGTGSFTYDVVTNGIRRPHDGFTMAWRHRVR